MSRRRDGTTLVEVLVAIFIMAIGLMTLLTLFPLGALSMAQAIQDTRAGHAAANAAALAEAKKIRDDDKVIFDFNPTRLDPNFRRDVFIEPLPRTSGGAVNLQLPPIPSNDPNSYRYPSYPVIVDPIGFTLTAHVDSTGSNTIGDPIGGAELAGAPGIPRRTTRYIYGKDTSPNPPQLQTRLAYAFHSLLDDIQFGSDANAGVPAISSSSYVEREGRYTWAYLLRRPRATDTSVVDVTVIVYKSRPAQAPIPEHVYANVPFKPGQTQLDLAYAAGAKPDIKKGDWVLDATLRLGSGINVVPEPHGYFYRVVGVTDNGGSLTLEFQEPIKGLLNPKTGNPLEPFTGTLIFMENVVEVFGRGPGWQP